jgi:UDP-N-acetylmuramate--alanine ligase
MIEGYNIFFSKIRKGGLLVVNSSIVGKIRVPEGIRCITYGAGTDATWYYTDIENRGECYSFTLKGPDKEIREILFPFPGRINIENATAAAALAMNLGITEQELRKALYTFKGVQRRFDIRVRKTGLTYIDDYAHHPEEIRAFVDSVREYFGTRKITGIFQPHLFTRTRDHAGGFAATLDKLDEIILLPVYPAREEPIPGVTSEMIFERMNAQKKYLAQKTDVVKMIEKMDIDVLVTIGAGDIDRLVKPIEELLSGRT